MNKWLFPVLLVAAVLTLSGCVDSLTNCVVGNGNVISETRDVEAFDDIALMGSASVYVTQGPQSLRVEAEENLLEIFDTKVENGKLSIGPTLPQCITALTPIKVFVSTPEIESLAIMGSGQIVGQTKIVSESLSVNLTGSGNVSLDVDTQELTTTLPGSGTISFEGTATSHDITVTGSGQIASFDLLTEETKVSLMGSGGINVQASSELDAKIAGSGAILYKGNPTLIQSVTGSGKIQKAD